MRRHTEKAKELMRLSKIGRPNYLIRSENNPLWKGDDVGYDALHDYINKYKPKPELCEECHKEPPADAANITGIYNRDFTNWRYLCRSCHAKLDGFVSNFGNYAIRIDMSSFRCILCGSDRTRIRKENGRPIWQRLNGKPLCTRCANRRYRLAQKESEVAR